MNKVSSEVRLSSVELELQQELNNYETAFKADAEFHVLKSIREKIKKLKAELQEKEAQDK